MRTADRMAMHMLDDVEALAATLRRIYPAAASIANDVSLSAGRTDGMAVRTSGVSDPTASAALDGRRAARQARTKKARKEIKAAVTALRAAVTAASNAADVGM